jgi:hypothetical protein
MAEGTWTLGGLVRKFKMFSLAGVSFSSQLNEGSGHQSVDVWESQSPELHRLCQAVRGSQACIQLDDIRGILTQLLGEWYLHNPGTNAAEGAVNVRRDGWCHYRQ